jgi:hypothetical protein
MNTNLRQERTELQEHGHIIDQKDAKEENVPLPGARTLDNEDEHVLLR